MTHYDPDVHTAPAGSYHHPRHYARVTPGPPSSATDADRIRRWRRQHGLSQAQLGNLLGVRPGQVSRYERGLAPVPAGVLLRILTAPTTSPTRTA